MSLANQSVFKIPENAEGINELTGEKGINFSISELEV